MFFPINIEVIIACIFMQLLLYCVVFHRSFYAINIPDHDKV